MLSSSSSSNTSSADRTGRTSRSSHRRETIDFGFASSLSLAARPTLSPLAEDEREMAEGAEGEEHGEDDEDVEQGVRNALLQVDASFARSLENMKQRRATTHQDGILDTPWTASVLAHAQAHHAQDRRASVRPRQQQQQQQQQQNVFVVGQHQDVPARSSRRIPPSAFETEMRSNNDVIPEPTR